MRCTRTVYRYRRRERLKERKSQFLIPNLPVVLPDVRVVPLPGGVVVVVLVTLAGTPVLLAFGGKTSGFSVLVDGVGDPVDSGITSDSLVRGVDTDDLVVLVDTVLVDPVRVQDSQVSTTPADTLLGGGSETSLELEVVDTLSDGFTVGGTLGHGLLPVSSSNSDSVDHVALLGLVTQSSSLVGSRRSGRSVDNGELSELPTPEN